MQLDLRRITLFVAPLVAAGLLTSGCGKIEKMLSKKADEQVAAEEEEAEAKPKKKKPAPVEDDEASPREPPIQMPDVTKLLDQARTGMPSMPSLPGAPKLPTQPMSNYLGDVTPVFPAFVAKVGAPLKVHEVVFYPEYVIAEIQDQKKKEHLDEYTLRNGTIGDPDPVRIIGTVQQMMSEVIEVNDKTFLIVPTLVKDAFTRLKVEDAKVSHVIFQRDMFDKSQIVFDVHVSGPRDSKYAEYDTTGRFLESH